MFITLKTRRNIENDIISYEEYHPFGTCAYRLGDNAAEVSLKRYRYNGKERDEETGLYYYGARYYAGWLGRFISVDPLAQESPDMNPYHYVRNNPVNRVDPDGMQDTRTYPTRGETEPDLTYGTSRFVDREEETKEEGGSIFAFRFSGRIMLVGQDGGFIEPGQMQPGDKVTIIEVDDLPFLVRARTLKKGPSNIKNRMLEFGDLYEPNSVEKNYDDIKDENFITTEKEYDKLLQSVEKDLNQAISEALLTGEIAPEELTAGEFYDAFTLIDDDGFLIEFGKGDEKFVARSEKGTFDEYGFLVYNESMEVLLGLEPGKYWQFQYRNFPKARTNNRELFINEFKQYFNNGK
jgi:RHS repeat-associated protein